MELKGGDSSPEQQSSSGSSGQWRGSPPAQQSSSGSSGQWRGLPSEQQNSSGSSGQWRGSPDPSQGSGFGSSGSPQSGSDPSGGRISGSGSGSQPTGSSGNQQSSSSGTKQTTSSSRTGSSSVTWNDNVEYAEGNKTAVSDQASEGSESRRRSSMIWDEEIPNKDQSETDSRKDSIRRFKEGSKIFAGFIEDAEGLQPNDDMLPPMTWEEKCEIIEELCTALEKRLDRLKNEKESILDSLKNYLDVAVHKIGMARKDRVEMHRTVIQFAELLNPSQKPYSEDMIRYLHGRILQKQILKENLQNRNRRIQKLVTSTSEQLENKVDVKDMLHTSDIMELRDLNKELRIQVDTRSNMLDKGRVLSRRMAKLTQTQGAFLEEQMKAKESMRQCLTDRSPLVGKFQELIMKEAKEQDKLELELLSVVKGEDLRPTAMEYMKLRQRSKDLRKELYTWLAKVQISELTHTELTKHLTMLSGRTSSRTSERSHRSGRSQVSS